MAVGRCFSCKLLCLEAKVSLRFVLFPAPFSKLACVLEKARNGIKRSQVKQPSSEVTPAWQARASKYTC